MIRTLLEGMNLSHDQTQQIINSFQSSTYNPFHLDCKYTQKMICECDLDPITRLAKQQRKQIANEFEPIKSFYSNTKDLTQSQEEIKQKLIQKVRNLQLDELKVFISRRDTSNQI